MEQWKFTKKEYIHLSPSDVIMILIGKYCVEKKKKYIELGLLTRKCIALGAGKEENVHGVISHMVRRSMLRLERGKGKTYVYKVNP